MRLAVLDPRFALQIARWPQVSATIVDRALIRARWLSFHLAVCHVVGIEKRLIILFWHLADRWGKVTPEGVRIALPLSHGMIAKLVGSRRPTVTTAMGKLREEGKILRTDDGAWILCGAPPDDLRNVRGGVGARDPRKDLDRRSATPKDPGGGVAPMAGGRRPRLIPLLRQARGDPLAEGKAARSARSERLAPRTAAADRVVASVCPYCAVGCGQRVYVQDERIIQIEGDPDSPDLARAAVPEGIGHARSSSRAPTREYTGQVPAALRRPSGRSSSLDEAMDMIADRVIATRAATWEEDDADGAPLRRTLGFAHLGGATLDNEENYLIKKLFTALGAMQIENQARI